MMLFISLFILEIRNKYFENKNKIKKIYMFGELLKIVIGCRGWIEV